MLGDLLNGPAQRDAQPQNDRSFGELNDAWSIRASPRSRRRRNRTRLRG